MSKKGLGAYHTIGAFVDAKLRAFDEKGDSFDTMFELMFSEEENVMFERSVGHRMVKTTYGEAKREIFHKASTLKELLSGLPEGAVVGIAMENSLSWIEIFWCVLLCGFSPLLVNLRLDRAAAEAAIGASGAQAVISDKNEYNVRTVKVEDVTAGQPIEAPHFGKEILVMTSGTSGEPKICAYTASELHAQILASRYIIKECRQAKKHYENRLKLLTFLPFYHVFGLIAVYIWFAFFSRTFVQLNDMAPATIVNTVKRHKVTHIFAVPLFWEKVYGEAKKGIAARGEKTAAKFEKAMRLSDKLDGVPLLDAAFTKLAFKEVRENIFGQSVCLMISGGSFIEPEVLRFFNNIGYYLTNGYGMSEIGITSVDLSKKRKARCDGSVGKPMATAEYMIADDGELLVRGRAMAAYVIENGEKKERSGWFRTGDLASEKNGRYTILGRKDDLVISGAGENLNPNLIEPLLTVPKTGGVCLIGADGGANRIPVLIVSVSKNLSPEGFEKIEEALKQKLEETGLSSFVGKVVYTTEPLIANDDFKKNRRRLKEAYENRTLQLYEKDRIEEDAEDRALIEELKAFFRTALDAPEEESIGQSADFFIDLGGTSLDYFSLLAALRTHYGLPFDMGKDAPHSVRDFYDYIRQNR